MSEANEQVLVFDDSVLDIVGRPVGFDPDKGAGFIQVLLDLGNPHFMDREIAEHNDEFRQLIPYCLVNYGNDLLTYVRTKKSGDERLRGKMSLAIGGHVNPVDEVSEPVDIYSVALYREIDEELHIEDPFTMEVVGVIEDDTNEVGRVHFGVVHVLELSSENVHSLDPAISDIKFMSLEELVQNRDKFETWSQLIIDRASQDKLQT